LTSITGLKVFSAAHLLNGFISYSPGVHNANTKPMIGAKCCCCFFCRVNWNADNLQLRVCNKAQDTMQRVRLSEALKLVVQCTEAPETTPVHYTVDQPESRGPIAQCTVPPQVPLVQQVDRLLIAIQRPRCIMQCPELPDTRGPIAQCTEVPESRRAAQCTNDLFVRRF
jgi:hypothetical protein